MENIGKYQMSYKEQWWTCGFTIEDTATSLMLISRFLFLQVPQLYPNFSFISL